MVLLIVLGALAIIGIVGTLVLVPVGQDNRFADRQRSASANATNRMF